MLSLHKNEKEILKTIKIFILHTGWSTQQCHNNQYIQIKVYDE